MLAQTLSVNLVGGLFGNILSLSFNKNLVSIYYRSGKEQKFEIASLSDFVVSKQSFLGTSLVLTAGDKKIKARFLRSSGAERFETEFNKLIAASVASLITATLKTFSLKAESVYLRDSSVNELDKLLEPLDSSFSRLRLTWETHLDENVINQVIRVLKFFPVSENVQQIRDIFCEKRLRERTSFYDSVESNPLTDQQRLAVVKNNDRNLVLAAAGTGKTSVMVAKALDLIDSGESTKDRVLILAYNKSAAIELRDRMLDRAAQCGIGIEKCPQTSTFHALGLSILKKAKVSTYLSDFVDDPIKLKVWTTTWIIDYLKASPRNLQRFIKLAYQPVDVFDFKTKEEYDAYVRDNEYRTLQGERVRGYQELLIANWLYLNGVPYCYEAPYVSKRRIEIGFDYRPDFHISETNLYLEHFGIDRQGKTRSDIDSRQYNDSIMRKRELHKECGTRLIETYHYDWTEGSLEERLEDLMIEQGVSLQPKSFEVVFNSLNESGFISDSVNVYLKCLQAIRTERLDKSALEARLKRYGVNLQLKVTHLLHLILTRLSGQIMA